MIIGIDFDNTIASYDQAFGHAASEMGLLASGEGRTKAEVKQRVLSGPEGETGWMRLQGRVYGYYIEEARLFPGFVDFVQTARRAGHDLRVISHKSRYGHFDPDRIDLVEAARSWMRRRGFFDRDTLGFAETEVSFHAERAGKLAAIAAAGCAVFIDDLPAVLDAPTFPHRCRPILFAPGGATVSGLTCCADWDAVCATVLP